MCLDPEHRRLFGDSSKVIWLEGLLPSILAAAYLQHVVSLAVKQALGKSGETMDQLATRIKVLGAPNTLRRKLRGEDWMSLANVTALELAFPTAHAARQAAPLLPI